MMEVRVFGSYLFNQSTGVCLFVCLFEVDVHFFSWLFELFSLSWMVKCCRWKPVC